MPFEWDSVVVGGGMSGLGAGIRLALAGQKVLLLEKHHALGGLNGYYFKGGFRYDVGLHALTNFVPKKAAQKPLTKLCRQLRLSYESLSLQPQGVSCIRFPGKKLEFNNDFEFFEAQVMENFPMEKDRFKRLVTDLEAEDVLSLENQPFVSARQRLETYLSDRQLIEMLLLPLLYYGSPTSHDMDWRQFVILFEALYREGFARPMGGVRTMIHQLRRQYQRYGGTLKVRCGVKALCVKDHRVSEIILETGETVRAKRVLSSVGLAETYALQIPPTGIVFPRLPLTFLETITVLQGRPETHRWPYTIVFYSHRERVRYDLAETLVDLDSGVICLPENYRQTEYGSTTTLRTTHLSNFQNWKKLSSEAYRRSKNECRLASRRNALQVLGSTDSLEILAEDMFTPLTLQRYTGHFHGGVYGYPEKVRDGRTNLENLFICGTDQGFLGIVGALLSGVSIANRYFLSSDV
jgi:phytoene dehydrogenase-like protein